VSHDSLRVLDLFFFGVHYDYVVDGDRTCLSPLAVVTETRERGPSSSKIWVLADNREDFELWTEGAGLSGLDTSKAERLLDPSQLRGEHLPFYVRLSSPDEWDWPAMDEALQVSRAIDIGPHLNAILAGLERILGPVGEGGRRVRPPTVPGDPEGWHRPPSLYPSTQSRGEVDGG
jgi:hypothetical protein